MRSSNWHRLRTSKCELGLITPPKVLDQKSYLLYLKLGTWITFLWLIHSRQHELYPWTCSIRNMDLAWRTRSTIATVLFPFVSCHRTNWSWRQCCTNPCFSLNLPVQIFTQGFPCPVPLVFSFFPIMTWFLCQFVLSSSSTSFTARYLVTPWSFWRTSQGDRFLH